MTAHPRRRFRPRVLQRFLHLVTGVAILAHLYLAPALGSIPDLAVRWLAAPALVLSGLVMWQGPKIKRRIRSRRRRLLETG